MSSIYMTHNSPWNLEFVRWINSINNIIKIILPCIIPSGSQLPLSQKNTQQLCIVTTRCDRNTSVGRPHPFLVKSICDPVPVLVHEAVYWSIWGVVERLGTMCSPSRWYCVRNGSVALVRPLWEPSSGCTMQRSKTPKNENKLETIQ